MKLNTLPLVALLTLPFLTSSDESETIIALEQNQAMQRGALRYLLWADAVDFQHARIEGIIDMLNGKSSLVRGLALSLDGNAEALKAEVQSYAENTLAMLQHCEKWAEEHKDYLDQEIAAALLTSAQAQLARMQSLASTVKDMED